MGEAAPPVGPPSNAPKAPPFIASMANALFARKLQHFPGKAVVAEQTKGVSALTKKPDEPFEAGLLGEFRNPWDCREWKILGMRPKRYEDGVYTEYEVLRLPKVFETDGAHVEEIPCRQRCTHILKVCRGLDKMSHSRFYHEYHVISELRKTYKNFRQYRHFPALFGIGAFSQLMYRAGEGWKRVYYSCKVDLPKPFFIQERLEPNLETVMKMTKSGDMNVASASYYTIGMVKALRVLHLAGYCHRRILPSSFAMRLPPDQMLIRNEAEIANYVAIVSFSVCRKYKTVPPRRTAPFVGTLKYSSVRAMEYYEQTAGDDLISACLILYEMISGQMPWQGLMDRRKILSMKKAVYKLDQVSSQSGNSAITGYSTLIKTILSADTFTVQLDYEEIISQLRAFTENAEMNFVLFGNRRENKRAAILAKSAGNKKKK